jgi:hypothetical protein
MEAALDLRSPAKVEAPLLVVLSDFKRAPPEMVQEFEGPGMTKCSQRPP